MRKQISYVNLIPVDGVYHPTEPVSTDMLEMIRKYDLDKVISSTVISDADKKAFAKKAMEKVSAAISDYCTANPDAVAILDRTWGL